MEVWAEDGELSVKPAQSTGHMLVTAAGPSYATRGKKMEAMHRSGVSFII